MELLIRQKLDLQHHLQQALLHDELQLTYQSQVDVRTNSAIAAEAMLNWQHPQHTKVTSKQLFTVAKEIDIAISLGEWVLRRACLQLKTWQKQGDACKALAIPLVLQQLEQPLFVEKFLQILEEQQVSADCLSLQLPAEVLQVGHEKIIENLRQFKQLGVKIVIQDFASHEIMLSTLSQIPIDSVKLSADFIGRLTQGVAVETLLQNVIGVAVNFGFVVIAEGVENAQQKHWLQQHGCYVMQGGLFAE